MTELEAMRVVWLMASEGSCKGDSSLWEKFPRLRQLGWNCGDAGSKHSNTVTVRLGDEVFTLRIERDVDAEREIADGTYPEVD